MARLRRRPPEGVAGSLRQSEASLALGCFSRSGLRSLWAGSAWLAWLGLGFGWLSLRTWLDLAFGWIWLDFGWISAWLGLDLA